VDCLVCRRRFESRAALMSHALTHRSDKEKEEYRDRLQDKPVRVKYRITPEDALRQHAFEFSPGLSLTRSCDGEWLEWDGDRYSFSPDLTTGERGFCIERIF